MACALRLRHIEHRDRLDAPHLAIVDLIGGDGLDPLLALHHHAAGFQPSVEIAGVRGAGAPVTDALLILGAIAVGA